MGTPAGNVMSSIHAAAHVDPPFRRIGIVGLGLIGGSIALRARAVWPSSTVVGLDRAGAIEEALRRAAVNEGADDLGALASSCECLVLAAPLGASLDLLDKLSRARATCVITDVGSTKRQVMEAAATLPCFVGGHPMAGSERSGLSHARAELFDGRPWLLVKGHAPDDAHARVESFVRGLGARPRWIDAHAHDRAVAYLSHLPQVLAVALMNAAREAVGDETIAAVAGRAFSEMTRLAVSPPAMWQTVLEQNSDFVTEALERLAAELPDGDDLGTGEWVRGAFARASARGRDRDGRGSR